MSKFECWRQSITEDSIRASLDNIRPEVLVTYQSFFRHLHVHVCMTAEKCTKGMKLMMMMMMMITTIMMMIITSFPTHAPTLYTSVML